MAPDGVPCHVAITSTAGAEVVTSESGASGSVTTAAAARAARLRAAAEGLGVMTDDFFDGVRSAQSASRDIFTCLAGMSCDPWIANPDTPERRERWVREEAAQSWASTRRTALWAALALAVAAGIAFVALTPTGRQVAERVSDMARSATRTVVEATKSAFGSRRAIAGSPVTPALYAHAVDCDSMRH